MWLPAHPCESAHAPANWRRLTGVQWRLSTVPLAQAGINAVGLEKATASNGVQPDNVCGCVYPISYEKASSLFCSREDGCVRTCAQFSRLLLFVYLHVGGPPGGDVSVGIAYSQDSMHAVARMDPGAGTHS